MKSFDQAARGYESFGFIQREMAQWLAEWLPARREGNAIEVAAGTGFFTEHLLPWQGSLLATDASAAMVARGCANLPQAQWSIANANHLPDLPADWIFSSSFLQWADDPVDLIRHWKCRIVPGGRVLAGLFAAPTLCELTELLPDSAPLKWRTSREWEGSVTAAGLRLIRSTTLHRTFTFPSARDLLRTLHGVGATPVRRCSGPALRKILKDYDARFTHPKGVRSTWTFHRFEAEKERILE